MVGAFTDQEWGEQREQVSGCDRELGTGLVELAVPGEHPRNYVDTPPLPLGILTLKIVNIECQNCRDSQVCQGTSDFMQKENV